LRRDRPRRSNFIAKDSVLRWMGWRFNPPVPTGIQLMVAASRPASHPHLARPLGRAALAAMRAKAAFASLESCHLCAHHCGVNRLTGAGGQCHAGAAARVFSAQIEVSDELTLAPTFAIAFGGCDLRCAFCITGRESWNALSGEPLDVRSLAGCASRALTRGARTIMFLGGEPTLFIPDALAIAAHLPDAATLVWKTNAHASAEGRALLDGVFDVWLADYKFGNDACAARLARVSGYTAIVQENLVWAARRHRLIIRHLIMPGHVECCWRPIAAWIARALPGIEVSLRDGFWPAWQSRTHAELSGPCTRDELALAVAIADEHSLPLLT
jgi:putative pyruvate formate lyase activating enzyme